MTFPVPVRRRSPGGIVGAVALVALLASGVTGLGPTAPAAAGPDATTPVSKGPCVRGSGVTVVTQGLAPATTRCTTHVAGIVARESFARAGHELRDAVRTPGFVCRVDGRPVEEASDCQVTPPATAYWSLWWSSGDGRWTYADVGAGSLTLPRGAWVAFSWHSGTAPAAPPSIRPQGPLAAKRLAVKATHASVKRTGWQRVSTSGLSSREKVAITYRGKVIARTRASASGTVSHRFRVGSKSGRFTVTVTGEQRNRSGSTRFRVR